MNLMDTIEGGFSRVNSIVFRQVNRARDWWQLPTPAALLNLRAYRDDMRQLNLYDTEDRGTTTEAPPELPRYRTYDGSLQDPTDPRMGMVGTRFGRNIAPDATPPEPPERILDPNPREVAARLLHRDSFKPATTLNVLAACWIQFQNHDWFGHGENDPDSHIEVSLPDGDDWPDGDPMKVRRTHPDRTHMDGSSAPPTYVNTVTASCAPARMESSPSRTAVYRTRSSRSSTAST
jgi:hypothetical protein